MSEITEVLRPPFLWASAEQRPLGRRTVPGELRTHVLIGHPMHKILDLVREPNTDLRVVGASGHLWLCDRMLSSRADRLVHLARCLLLVVK